MLSLAHLHFSGFFWHLQVQLFNSGPSFIVCYYNLFTNHELLPLIAPHISERSSTLSY